MYQFNYNQRYNSQKGTLTMMEFEINTILFDLVSDVNQQSDSLSIRNSQLIDSSVQMQQKQKSYQISFPHILIKETNFLYYGDIYHTFELNLHKIYTKLQLSQNQYEYYEDQQQPMQSKKQFKQSVIYIGNHLKSAPNFIILNYRMISQNHCKIQKFKNDLQPLCKQFITFLYCIQFRSKMNPLFNLPNGIVNMIFQYAKNPHGYHIMETQSKHGTFLKLRQKQQFLLNTQDIFKIDLDSQVNYHNYQLKIKQKFQICPTLQLSKHNHLFILSIIRLQKYIPGIKMIGNFDICNTYQKYYWLRLTWKYQNQIIDYLISSCSPQILEIRFKQNIIINNSIQTWKGIFKFNKRNWYLRDGGTSYSTWKELEPNRYYKLSNQDRIKLAKTTELQFYINSPQTYLESELQN